MHIECYKNIYKNDIMLFLSNIFEKEFKFATYEKYICCEDYSIFLNKRNNLLILFDDDKIIGTCGVIDIDDNTGKINSFCIDKKYRNKGYGKLLLIKQELFITNNFDEVILCNNKKFNSSSFCENAGFTPYRYEPNGTIWYKKTY